MRFTPTVARLLMKLLTVTIRWADRSVSFSAIRHMNLAGAFISRHLTW
jgi:hypothetical protein